MPLDFDPLYHTETMVKILREQGSTQYAMELAEAILRAQPQQEGVAKILEELKEEVRRHFERFRNSGRVAETGMAETSESTEGAADAVAVSEKKNRKISQLQLLLEKIQNYRKNYEANQA